MFNLAINVILSKEVKKKKKKKKKKKNLVYVQEPQ